MFEVIDGFLLTRQWDDCSQPNSNKGHTKGHTEGRTGSHQQKQLLLTLWIISSKGPVRLQISDQEALLFVAQREIEEARLVLTRAFGPAKSEQNPQGSWHDKALELKTFSQHKGQAIYFREQRAIYRARDLLKQHRLCPYEADIQPADRFLMERFINGSLKVQGEITRNNGFLEISNPRIKASHYQPAFSVLSLDIETSLSGNHLYSIGLLATHSHNEHFANQRRVFVVNEHHREKDPSDDQADYLVFCQDESALLHQFMHWFHNIDPDIIIGWNVINFDLRFLQKKAEQLNISLNLGRDRSALLWRQSQSDNEHYTLLIPGRSVLDGIDTLKSATHTFESFSLQYVAKALLQRGKLIHDNDNRGEEITRLFRDDKASLAAYNLEDCQLVWDIFSLTHLIDFAVERAQLTGLAMDRFGGSVAAFDNRYLPRLHRAGYIAPNLATEPIGVGSPGGYVMDSYPGIYDHVLVLDFKSLYPSIIRTFKIDPMGLIEGIEASPHEKLQDQRETNEADRALFVPGYNGALFSKERNILPDIIGQLWAARDQAKKQKNATMSHAIKIIMNSFYGVLGSPGCRFFDYRLPSSITLRGHFILNHSKKLIEERNYQVIYGDTDSVFVWLRDSKRFSAKEADDIGNQLASELNQWWKDYLRQHYQIESYLEIEFETHFKRFVMPTIRGSERGSKKRYAGLVQKKAEKRDEKGDRELELVFKGLEAVRTDWTQLAREFQRELYRRIFYNEAYEDFILQTLAAIREGNKDEQLIYRKRIRRRLKDYQRNVPPHVKAARIADDKRQDLGLPPAYERGGWIEYYMTTNGAEPVEFSKSTLDYELYIERQIKPIADGILHFLNASFEEITDSQIGLFDKR